MIFECDFSRIKDFYNKLYKDKHADSMRPYNEYQYFIRYLKPEKGTKLLDIACGTGYLLKVSNTMGLRSYGIDISIEACRIASSIVKTGVINATGEYLPFKDNTFDYITCIGSLEHFMNMENGIRELLGVGKSAAQYCIVVPNAGYKYAGTDQIEEKLLFLPEWKALFLKCGLKVQQTHKDNYLARKINLFQDGNLLRIFRRVIEKCWLYLIPTNKAYQFIFICKKLNEE